MRGNSLPNENDFSANNDYLRGTYLLCIPVSRPSVNLCSFSYGQQGARDARLLGTKLALFPFRHLS